MAYFTNVPLPTHFVSGPVRPRLGAIFVPGRLGAAARPKTTRYTATRMRALAKASATKYKIPVALVLAIAQRESAFKPWVVSKSGAQGLMQLMPGTGRTAENNIGKAPLLDGKPDFFSPAWNVTAGAWLISHLLRKFKSDIRDALVAYVGGSGNATKWGGYYGEWKKKADGTYRLARAPTKVRAYVDDVLKNFIRFGGAASWIKTHTKRTATPPKPGVKVTPSAQVAKVTPLRVPPKVKPPTTVAPVVTDSEDGGGALFFLLALVLGFFA